MHKKWKRFLAVSIAVLLIVSAPMSANIFAGFALTASAASYSGTCGENLTWTLNTTTGILAISGTGEMKDYYYFSNAPWYSNRSSIRAVQIADSVTSIGNSAFYDCTSLTSVTIPNSVTSIGEYAFESCTSLTSITIGDSVTSIGDDAFYGCTSLTSVTIPDSVTSIGQYAFYDCTSLTSVTIPDSVTGIGDFAFRGCTSLTSVTIGDSVTSIGDQAFSHCASLTSVTIPDSVTSIGWWAFSDCTSLTSVTIPDSVTSIGNSAFYRCTSLTCVTIPDSVTSIGADAFYYCTSLTSITIPDSVTSIGGRAFYYCTGLTSITVKEGNPNYSSDEYGVLLNKDKTTLIQYPAGSTLTEYAIPDSVTSIGEYAFAVCVSLTSVTIPDSVTSIGKYAFAICVSLTSVTIPDSVTSIGSGAFSFCTSLTRITIPDSVTSIGDETFSYCKSLTSVTIGNSVSNIGDNAFKYCTSLTSVNISDSVTCIGYSAFSCCTSLTSVTIPDSVKSIGSYAFEQVGTVHYAGSASGSPWGAKSVNGYVEGNFVYENASKTKLVHCSSAATGEIILPDSVTSIGEQAFYYCTSLTSVTIGNSVTSIGDGAFYYCTSLTSVNIPDSVTSIGEHAFAVCVSLTSMTIGNSVTNIGKWAFGGCVCLASVTIPKSITRIVAGAFLQFGTEELEYLQEVYNEAILFGATTIEGIPLQTVKTILDHPQGSLSDVYFLGTREEWNAVGVDEGNESLLNATIHCMDDKPPCEHNYIASITIPPTCTAVGECTYTCDICGDSYTKEVDALGHDYSIIAVMQKPSCTENGYNIIFCAHDMTHNYLVPTYATGHSYDSVVTAPTCTEQGYTTHTCTVCGDSYRDSFVDPLPAIFIRNYKGETTVDYRTTITFAAEVPRPIDGAEVHWFVDGKDMGTGDTYTVKEAKKTFTVQAKYMQDGKTLAESETETVSVKIGFFAKLVAFFKALFCKLPVLVQEYVGMEKLR